MTEIPEIAPWWGYNKHHGWVVIDRTIPTNSSGRGQHFLFFCCRDSTTFVDNRSRWAAPLYVYATTYISGLGADEAAVAAKELTELRSRWPQFKEEIRQQYEAQQAQQNLFEKERAERERSDLDERKKEQKNARKKSAQSS